MAGPRVGDLMELVVWNPDINDGVRVNVAPLQRLGLLAGRC
jgi:hypothetical protein